MMSKIQDEDARDEDKSMSLAFKLKIMVTALALGTVIYLKFFVDFDELVKESTDGTETIPASGH